MNASIDQMNRSRLADPVVTPALVDAPADSAVSWAAIFAGAAAAAAMSLILLLLGTGFGLSSVSPWAFEGVSAETFGWSTIVWISVTSIVASGLGGYLAGRLRTRWVSIHGDETYFRDTAHGFLAWCVATLITAAVLTSAVGAILGAGAKAGAALTGAAATTAAAGVAGAGAVAANGDGEVSGYFVDSMFRSGPAPTLPQAAPVDPAAPAAAPPPPPPAGDLGPVRDEAMRIIANSLRTGSLTADDTRYLGQLVAQRTGITQQEAEARVTDARNRMQAALDEAKTKAKEAADAARKATAYAALWLFITLLMGAFTASLLATFGGRQRDR